MVKTATNEGRCCDAVLRIFESEHGEQRREVIRDTPTRRGIDISCYIGNQHYAVEHTLIELQLSLAHWESCVHGALSALSAVHIIVVASQ